MTSHVSIRLLLVRLRHVAGARKVSLLLEALMATICASHAHTRCYLAIQARLRWYCEPGASRRRHLRPTHRRLRDASHAIRLPYYRWQHTGSYYYRWRAISKRCDIRHAARLLVIRQPAHTHCRHHRRDNIRREYNITLLRIWKWRPALSMNACWLRWRH